MRADIARNRPGRKIGYHHFALFRGHLDGLSLDTLGDRYLETGTDLRQATRTLRWVRDELIAAAKRYQAETGVTQASLARLLRIEPERLKPEERIALAEIPSLEDFQADFDPVGFYAEAELIEEFQKRYGGTDAGGAPGSAIPTAILRKTERNDRLRKRLRQAIDTLEHWIASVPKPTDPIDIWLEPIVARRLTPAGIVSIEDLVGLINRRGNLWYRRIPKFGAVRARRIIRWLQINRVLPIEERALVPYRQIARRLPAQRTPEYAIVPYEHLALSADLSGIVGTNRGHDCQMPSLRDDRDAIDAWLELKGDKPNTRRAYLAQAERFLLWLVMEKGRALSSATPEDCFEYTKFLEALANPGTAWSWRLPRAAWVGDKRPRWSPDWKPFTGTLTIRSRQMAITILKGLFVWLLDLGYLRRNPWVPVKTPKASGRSIQVDHALNARQWAAVVDELAAQPQDERYFRLRFLLWLGYSGGLRQDEMLRLTTDNLQRTPEGDWELKFLGKGGKEREVPLARTVFGYLQDYLEARGHGRNPLTWLEERGALDGQVTRPALPLLTALAPELQQVQKGRDQPLSARMQSQLLKRHFDAAAERLDDMLDQYHLRQASTHWLRHTAATVMIDRGAQVAVVQEILGHSNSATTALYTHADRKRMREAVEWMTAD
jgi:site-specific recombinase XerD